ncbi:hypothetical protein HPO96_31630 [Kribbella sandramycini]|uniref:glutamate--cysteine ligase n=1 Tax=Kribbella sandramycini TaxID=60450 RepID=A0A7Y4L5N2_9ACTN|nr:glutamate-cysteine ligase family protein [Kribbella sandramycini]MBB6567094.1 glutamate--cysteine ligase [Kribbella sandramycini]NOL44812.1 hypothetical protein [Kribbella sandramycini]
MNPQELSPFVGALFARGRRRSVRVAVEQEFLVADAVTGAAVPIGRTQQAAGSTPYVGFEPGGQLELSLPCGLDPAGQLRNAVAGLTKRLAADRITLYALPVDPRPEHEVPLQLTSPRYVAMHRHFDSIGPAGRRMMRRTASTQICLDWWPGRAGAEQWRVLNLAAPFLAATFARSSGPQGRLATWLELDPARTGFDDRLLYGDDPVAAYTSFAAGATVFTTGGPAEHLTTMFPPVRPRSTYLEVRFLDAQEPSAVDQVITTLTSLLYDDVRRRSVLRALEPERTNLAAHWQAAAAGELLHCKELAA